MSPVLKISSSGFEPAAYMRSAMILMLRGELITAPPPNHCVLRSSVQISGFSSTHVLGANLGRGQHRAGRRPWPARRRSA